MRMTGPAPCAWIIGALLLACPMACVRAAVPRDAVRQMPSITHSSSFNLNESTTKNGESFSDNYNAVWEIRWDTPPVPLGNAASAYMNFYYKLALKDNLDRIAHSSDDMRNNHYRVAAHLDAPYFAAGYSIDQDDTWSGMYSDTNLPVWSSSRSSGASLHWALPNLPVLDVSRSETLSYPQAGRGLGSEAESMVAWLYYDPPRGAFDQYYKVTTEFFRSRNYDAGTATRSSRTTYEGNRELPLGALGSLAAAYTYSEESQASPGSTAPVTTSNSFYTLGLGGQVLNMPLGYTYSYSNQMVKTSSGADYSRQGKHFELRFDSPAPQGKSASVKYTHDATDYQNEPSQNAATSDEAQALAWEFKLNDRTAGFVNYTTTNHVNRASQQRTNETESLGARMSYQIPGKRGSMVGVYTQTIERSPDTGSDSLTTSMDLSTNVKLGPRASLRLFMNQLYSDTGTAPALARGTDKFSAGVTYSIGTDVGLALNTTWKQSLTNNTYNHRHDGKSSATQNMDFTLSYNPVGTQWSYAITYAGHDDSKDSLNNVKDNNYESHNTIQATVSYSF